MSPIRRSALALALAVALAATGAPARAAAAQGIAFDQLDLPVTCESGCLLPLHGPGSFDADYARFVSEHPDDKHPYTPGILYHVAIFDGWTRVEAQGVVTICSPRGDDLIVLDPARRVAYHDKSILTTFFKAPGGCRSVIGRDYYRVERIPGTQERLAPVVVDGVRAQGRAAKYAFHYDHRDGSRSGPDRTFRIVTYSADLPEPCPAPRAIPSMSVFGNACAGDKRFLIFRTSIALDPAGRRPAFVRGGLGILNERGHIRPLRAAGDLFSIPAGYADACGRHGRDAFGLCPAHRFHAPRALDKDKD